MPFLDVFYSEKESRVLIGNTGITKEGYFATLCFLTDKNEFVSICLTREQLLSIQEVIAQGVKAIDREIEKNNIVKAEIEEILRGWANHEE
ncbi:hypothetical protein Q5692_31740 [Microcoleus sp. C2C3]|uniref:hypothetical protein n=1 Tax=unclassified Microcoleus TaxID=2642155 RepID=UPI002FD27BD2